MRRSILFVALYLIIAGLTILLANLLHLDISVFTILFAEAIIMLGVFLITGGNNRAFREGDTPAYAAHGPEENFFFANGSVAGAPETAKYTITFSSVTLELPEDAPELIEITCIFSDVRVFLPKERAVRVRISASFGSAGMPGGSVTGFGSREAMQGEGTASFLSGDAVFSSLFIA